MDKTTIIEQSKYLDNYHKNEVLFLSKFINYQYIDNIYDLLGTEALIKLINKYKISYNEKMIIELLDDKDISGSFKSFILSIYFPKKINCFYLNRGIDIINVYKNDKFNKRFLFCNNLLNEK